MGVVWPSVRGCRRDRAFCASTRSPTGRDFFDLPGHEDVVFSLAIRPDGARLASASFDQTVRVWDLGSGAAVGSFRGHSDFVYAVAYSPDGRTLFTAGKDRTIKRLEAGSLKEERTYSGHDQDVLALAVHPDGKRFATAGEEPQIRWWTRDGKKPEARRGGHSGPVHQLAFSRDGKRLVSAAGDRSVRLWDGMSGTAIRQLDGPVDWQYAVGITADGHRVASGGWDGRVFLWDADSRPPARRPDPAAARGSIPGERGGGGLGMARGHDRGLCGRIAAADGPGALAVRRFDDIRQARLRRPVYDPRRLPESCEARPSRPFRSYPHPRGSHEIGLIVLIGMTIGEGCVLASAASGQTSYPMIMRVEPVVVTRGQSMELTISGREKFDGAFGLICQQPGLRGEILKVEANERPETKARQGRRRQATPQVKARLDVAADAPLGPREVRVATPQGVSTVGLVVVGDEPVILEGDDQANDRPAERAAADAPVGRLGADRPGGGHRLVRIRSRAG